MVVLQVSPAFTIAIWIRTSSKKLQCCQLQVDEGNANVGYVHIQGGQLQAGKTNIGDFCTVRKRAEEMDRGSRSQTGVQSVKSVKKERGTAEASTKERE